MKAKGKVKLKHIDIKTSPNSAVQLIPVEEYDEFKKSKKKKYSEWKKEKQKKVK